MLVRSEAGLLVDAGTVVRFGDFVVKRFSTRPGSGRLVRRLLDFEIIDECEALGQPAHYTIDVFAATLEVLGAPHIDWLSTRERIINEHAERVAAQPVIGARVPVPADGGDPDGGALVPVPADDFADYTREELVNLIKKKDSVIAKLRASQAHLRKKRGTLQTKEDTALRRKRRLHEVREQVAEAEAARKLKRGRSDRYLNVRQGLLLAAQRTMSNAAAYTMGLIRMQNATGNAVTYYDIRLRAGLLNINKNPND